MTRAMAVILAAGAGTRLGGVAKALLEVAAGRTFLAAIAETMRAAGVASGVVVVGEPHAAAVGAEARRLGLEVATNPEPARGMASSVATGFTAAGSRAGFAGADVALLWPVDHPHVTAATIERVLAALAQAADPLAAIPTHAGRGGHPPAIRRALWPALAGCGASADGARGVLAAVATVRVPVDDAGVTRDVDEPADMAQDHER
jgi:CTP:molybdopterin cytidylyltransferase MocA